MSNPRLHLVGLKFARLTIIAFVGKDSRQNTLWRARCDCGKETVARGTAIKLGRTASCGCGIREAVVKANTKHGHVSDPLYHRWRHMIARTTDPEHISYKNYGARGISVCADWRDFATFRDWSRANGFAVGLSLDRVNNDGNYEPQNCRWASAKEQAANRRPRSNARKQRPQSNGDCT